MNVTGPAASASCHSDSVQLQRQLQNVFRVLAHPDHKLRDAAIRCRLEVSTRWCVQAARAEWFPWPSTSASPGVQRLKRIDCPPHGMLSFLGYHVGEILPTPESMRRCILEYAFECHLPPLSGNAYYLQWGVPLTAQRLHKMANTLAALTRNAKRRDDPSWAKAIADWEGDLDFIHQRYYLGFFRFAWPGTSLLH